MDVIGLVTDNMLLFLAAAIVCAIISLAIITNAGRKAVNHVAHHGIEEAFDSLANDPGKIAKPAIKTGIGFFGFHIITAICWFLFIISAIINVVLWVKNH